MALKHTHTHPNWANLSHAEKARVRKKNHAIASNKRIIKDLEERLLDAGSEDEIIKHMLWKRKHPDYDPEIKMVRSMGIEKDFLSYVSAAFRQYEKETSQ